MPQPRPLPRKRRAIALDEYPEWSRWFDIVMAGLPAIHVLRSGTKQDVDARLKAGHDERREQTPY